MSHDIEAHWAGAALAAHLVNNPSHCFATPPSAGALSSLASREGRNIWPHADGVIELTDTSVTPNKTYPIALEFKRENEGIHGTLTALGQAHAYIHKGYAGSAIVIPRSYTTLANAGSYLNDVIQNVSHAQGIGVFSYDPPDRTLVSPFEGKLTVSRPLQLNPTYIPTPMINAQIGIETQWAHVREGSTEPDALFKYLQSLKLMTIGYIPSAQPTLPTGLLSAVNSLAPGTRVDRYLSNAPGNNVTDDAWRNFWFKFVLTDPILIGWTQNPLSHTYIVGSGELNLLKADGSGFKQFFAGRQDSIKNKLTSELNLGTITVTDAWKALAENFHGRAHSYREDIDSSCEHFGFIDDKGLLTTEGYQFIDACERYKNPNNGIPRELFAQALLGEGGLGAFLHYIWRLSEDHFATNPLAFTNYSTRGKLQFDSNSYLNWIKNELANKLHVLKIGTIRGGTTSRKAFQAELALLRNLKLVGSKFRVGVGLSINWPEIQRVMQNAHN